MYKFILEPVLNHKKFIEEGFQKDLAECKKLLSDEKLQLQIIKDAEKRHLTELRQKHEGGITIPEILLYAGFIKQLSKDFGKQKVRVLEVEKEFDQKREALIEAMKNRKTLEKLKEKRHEAYRLKLIKKELDFYNEVAVSRFNHLK